MYLYVSLCNGQYIHTYTYKYTYLCQLSLHPFHPLSRSLAWFSSFFIFYFSILSLFSNVVLLFALKLIFVFVFNIKAVVKCDWVNLDCRSLKFVSFGFVSFTLLWHRMGSSTLRPLPTICRYTLFLTAAFFY